MKETFFDDKLQSWVFGYNLNPWTVVMIFRQKVFNPLIKHDIFQKISLPDFQAKIFTH